MGVVAKEICKGVMFTSIAKYSSILVNIIVTAILARVLQPSEFGVVALTTVMVSFFDLLGNMGLGPSIIQHKSLDNQDINTLFTLSLFIAIVFAAICYLSSGMVGLFYSNNQLPFLLKLLCFQIFFTISSIVPYSLLLKNKEFGIIAIIQVFSQLFLGICAVFSAYFGFGVYSLLIAPIGSSIILFISSLVYNVLKHNTSFRIYFRKNSVNKVLSFSIYQFLFNVVNYLSRNLDKLLIGKNISMSELGYYEKSYRLMGLPLSTISSVLNPTIQPVLSNYQNQKELLYNYVNSIITILSYVGFFLTPLLFFTSKELVLIVFGSQWVPAILIFQILSLSVFAQTIDSASGPVMQSANEPQKLFLSGLICAIINVFCIVLGAAVAKSIVWLACLMVIAFVFNVVISLYYIYIMIFNKSFKYILRLFLKPLLGAILTSMALWFISLNSEMLPLIPSLLIKITIALIVYFLYLFFIRALSISMIKQLFIK